MLLCLFRKDRSSAVALKDSSKLGNLTKEINEANMKFFNGDRIGWQNYFCSHSFSSPWGRRGSFLSLNLVNIKNVFCWQQTVFGTQLFSRPDSEFYHEDRGGLGRELRMVLKAAEAVRWTTRLETVSESVIDRPNRRLRLVTSERRSVLIYFTTMYLGETRLSLHEI